MKALLEDTSDPNNLVAQIYEKYKHIYDFIYFFEQKFVYNSGGISGVTNSYMEPDYDLPDSTNPTALGNLTMINKYKFEIREVSDIRMAPAIYSKRIVKVKKVDTPLLSIDGQQNMFDPLFNDKSLATVTYCYFTDNSNTPVPSIKPGIIGTPGVSSSSGQVKKRVLPGLQSIPNFKPSESDDLEKIKKVEKLNSLPVDENDVEEGSVEGENGDEGSVSNNSESSSKEKDENEELYPEENEENENNEQDSSSMEGGNNQIKEWYEKDNTEDEGYTNFLSSFIKKFIPVVKTPKGATATPCVKYNDPALIPHGQIFGIINIKLDSERTEKNAKNDYERRKDQQIKQKQSIEKLTPPLTKAAIEVFLISSFIYRLRLRYFLSGSTDDNPIFISGNFNFNIPYTSKIQDIYSKTPALKLMLSKSKTRMKGEDYKEVLGEKYWEIIDKFILQCQILNYLYGGLQRVGRFKLIGYENNIIDDNLFGNTISLSKNNFNTQQRTQFIFTTRKLKLCPKEEIHKMTPQEEKDDLPDFPDNVNPSNSNAIGGVFEVTTSAVNQIISQHIAEQELQKQSEEGADISAILSSIQEEDEEEDEEEGEELQTGQDSSRTSTSTAEDKPDFTKTSKPVSSKRTDLVPPVVASKVANRDLSFFDSPYPRYVSICDSGKDVDQYLTTKPMNTWKTTDPDIFSDHSPVKYDIDSSVDSNGKHKCGQTQAGGGDSTESVMVGGIGNIKLITWNVAGLGGQNTDSKGKIFYYHKFIGKVKETDDLYKRRIKNNTKAISDMMNSGTGYDYTLIQEGPTENSAIAIFTQEVASNNLNVLRGGINAYNTQFYLITKKSDKSRYVVSGVIKIKGKPAIPGKSAKPAQTLYTNDGFAQTIFKEMSVNFNENYKTDDFEKDFSSLWFFINETKKQILISVHFPLDPERLEFTDQRQDEIYSLLNSIVTFIRTSKYPVMIPYRDFDIVFAGDYNINMLERLPNNIRPSFLRCTSIPEQETLIYTSKDNAPSSFGGENNGEYNPTNIDFAIYYPQVTLKPVSVVKTAVSTKPKLTGSMISSLSSSSAVTKVVDITINKQNQIFKLSKPPPSTGLENFVSVLGTSYNQVYGSQKIMPPGSATLLDISKLDFHKIRYDTANDVSTTDNVGIKAGTVKYMIQASPAMSGGVLITRDTLANSVMNSIILANQNKVKKIMIPFIGGNLFKTALQKVVPNYSMDEHAKILLEGVIKYNFYVDNYKIPNSINEIMFCIYDKEKQAMDKAIYAENLSKQVKTSSGQTNIINETVEQFDKGIVFEAIVNAANAELQFGSGVSGMCYAAIDEDNNSQLMLTSKKQQFIRAFNEYLKSTGVVSAVVPATKPSPVATGTKSSTPIVSGISGAPSSPTDVAKMFPVLGLGTPLGFVTITGDKYNTWLQPGDIQNPKIIDSLHITSFYYDTNNYLHAFFAGTKLLYYETKVIKDTSTNKDYTWYKCWFSFNTTSFLIDDSEIINIFKLSALNPLGAGGMFVWLPFDKGKSKTITYITPKAFDPNQVIAITKFLNDCKQNIQKEINDIKIKFIKDTLAGYDAGYVFMSDKLKKALEQMDASLKMPSKPSISSPSSPAPAPSPSPAAASPVLKSLAKTLASDTKKKRAKIQTFVDMQTKTTGRPNFDTAFNEILQGRKSTHWIWYIIPSDINKFSSDESLLYGIGPNASALGKTEGLQVVTVSEYLNNSILRDNYIKIISEIGKQLDKYEKSNVKLSYTSQDIKKFLINLMGGYDANGIPVDYNKLTSSVLNFQPELLNKNKSNFYIDNLHKVLKYFYDEDQKGKVAPGKGLPAAPPKPSAPLDIKSKEDQAQEKKEFDEFMITPQTIFTSKSDEGSVDKNIDAIANCIKDPNIKFTVTSFLKDQVYAAAVYYILNDLFYFTNNTKSEFFSSNKQDCIAYKLFANGVTQINLLKDMELMTTQEFNTLYLIDEKTVNDIYELKKELIKKISSDAKKVSDVIDYLYNTQRYSIFMYLIKRDSPDKGKEILIELYGSLFNKVKDKEDENIEEIVEKIKKIKKITKPSDKKSGREGLLDVIGYDFMRSDGNGNCYYNSIGMLTMAGFNKQQYERLSIDQQNEIQFREQSRVRRDLTAFARAIYDRIQGFNIDSYLQQNRDRNVVMVRYLLNNGPNFGIINRISRSVDPRYYGSENEIYFTSLMYERPVVSLPGVEEVTRFDIIWFNNYRPNGQRFIDYVNDPSTTDRMIVDFLANNARRQPHDIGDTIDFLMNHPNSYIIIGGRGHWSYALPRIAGGQAGGTIQNNKTRKNTSSASVNKIKLSNFGVNKNTRKIKMYNKTKKINYGTVKHNTRKHKRH
jgi:O-acetyl-ADP-ribose deacetylase (regulator of RNase III)